MKILQLCHKPPVPPVDGGTLAMYNLATGFLEQGVELQILCISTPKHPFLDQKIEAKFKERTKISSVFVNTSLEIIDALNALIKGQSYNISRFFNKKFDTQLKQILAKNNFDVVLLESLFLAPYMDTIRTNCKTKIVLRSHNVEHFIWEQKAKNSTSFFKKKYLHILSNQLKKEEIQLLNNVDLTACITSEDKNMLHQLAPQSHLVTVPFGIAIPTDLKGEKQCDIGYLGALDWGPNIEGLSWFVEKVIQPVITELPDVKIHIAGKNSKTFALKNKFKNLTCLNEVSDAKQFMKNCLVFIAPVFSGSGVKVKIIEAMSLGIPVITTSHGITGLSRGGVNSVLVADTPIKFSKAVVSLLQSPKKREILGASARNYIVANYDKNKIASDFINTLNKLVEV